jgi:dihydrofolate synthase / folylpolyglutamate synthase
VLSRLAAAGVRLGLERVGSFLGWLGSPQAGFPMVHVAGTNGKGSTTAVIAAILQAQGLRTGWYTSPHLQHVNERVRVNGRAISDGQLHELLEEVAREAGLWAAAQALELPDDTPPLTYFEALTACAFLAFHRTDVDVAVAEVGLGGRLDATRTGRAVVTAITSVGLDHCDVLGPDLASVAYEKAGIFRAGVPAVIGPLHRDAARVVRSQAGAVGAPAVVWGEDFETSGGADDFSFRWRETRLDGLKTALQGEHQVRNAGVALATLMALGEVRPDLQVTEAAVRAGLDQVRHPGRCEWLTSDVLVDGAHNVEAAQALADYLRSLGREQPCTLLLGVSGDKDVRAVVAPLMPYVARICTTHCDHPRAVPAGQVAEALVDLSVPVLPAGPIEEALGLARQFDGLLVIAGSLFLAGAVRDLLRP